MKKAITIVLLLYTSTLYAQYDLPVSKQEEAYGTTPERSQQDAIQQQSQSGYLCRLVGFKGDYLNKLSAYLQLHNNYSFINTPDLPGYYVYNFNKKGIYVGDNKPSKLVLMFAVDAKQRIKSGTIKGPFIDLADLFINYWPMDAEWLSDIKLKPGVVAQKHSFGDLITFNWSGATPFIKVTKDPNVTIPIAVAKTK